MSTFVLNKQSTPVVPATDDLRFWANDDGEWCSIDEAGNVRRYWAHEETVEQWAGVPVSAGSAGVKGQFASDGSYIYICIQDNTWIRFPVTFAPPFTFRTEADANKGLIVKANSATQSANLQEWQDSAGAAKSSVCPLGCATFTGLNLGIRTVTSAPTLTGADYTLLCDTTSAGFTVTLPAAASSTGRILNIKKMVAANSLVIDGNASETIDGSLTLTLTSQYSSVTIQCDGTKWVIL